MGSSDYDVIIIGAGPGGYVAAIRAAQLGMRTAVVEHAHLGGICLNWGCIPTKALLRSAEILHAIGEAKEFGVRTKGAVEVDLKALVGRSRRVAAELNTGVGFLLKKNGVDVIWGQARLAGQGAIDVVAPPPRAGDGNPEPPKDARGPGRYTAGTVLFLPHSFALHTSENPIFPSLVAFHPPESRNCHLLFGCGRAKRGRDGHLRRTADGDHVHGQRALGLPNAVYHQLRRRRRTRRVEKSGPRLVDPPGRVVVAHVVRGLG